MKKILLGMATGVIVLFLNGSALAEAPSCQPLKDACMAAGYSKGGYRHGKGLYEHCVQPFVQGKTVPRVHVTVAMVESCCQLKALEKAKKAGT